MDYRACSDSKSLYLIRYHLHFLLLLLLSAPLPSIMAENYGEDCPIWGCGYGDKEEDSLKSFLSSQGDNYEDKQPSGKPQPAADQCSCPKCPPVRECPLITIRPEASEQLKENLAPVIRQRLRDLLKKALTVESATQAVETIDLLKLIDASNSKLDRIRDSAHQGAQLLMSAFAEIPQHV